MPFRHGVRRRSGGGLRVTLASRERDALRALPATLHPVLTGDADGDLAAAVRQRLFPRAYEEEEFEQEYRSMVRDDLVAERVRAVTAFAETLERGKESGRTWVVDLDPDEAALWLAVVNDSRLALGALLGVASEGHWEDGPDPDNPASMLLWYLGWLEEGLVQAMMGSLPDS